MYMMWNWVSWSAARDISSVADAGIRTQISAAHSKEDLDFAIEKITDAKRELGI